MGRPGTGSGQRRPAGGRWVTSPLAHTVQALTYSRVSAAMVRHQKWCWSRDKVQKAPGWQVNRDVWVHWKTWGRTETGTNKRPWGPPPGSELVCRAVLTKDSISLVRELIRHDAGGIMSGTGGLSLLSRNCLDNVSGLTFVLPGR